MSVSNFKELAHHVGHKIEVVTYASQSAAIECVDCYVVLLDFDHDDEDEEEDLPLSLQETRNVLQGWWDNTNDEQEDYMIKVLLERIDETREPKKFVSSLSLEELNFLTDFLWEEINFAESEATPEEEQRAKEMQGLYDQLTYSK